jgi:hypothetical protein
MKRVTGLGGIFFKTPGPEELKGWHRRHLGIESDPGVSRTLGAGGFERRSLPAARLTVPSHTLQDDLRARRTSEATVNTRSRTPRCSPG